MQWIVHALGAGSVQGIQSLLHERYSGCVLGTPTINAENLYVGTKPSAGYDPSVNSLAIERSIFSNLALKCQLRTGICDCECAYVDAAATSSNVIMVSNQQVQFTLPGCEITYEYY